ncbi:hypothetical protein [Limibacillus halophilus]|jgi:hypothetical protein
MERLRAFLSRTEGKAPEAFVIFAALIAIIAISLGVLLGPGKVQTYADVEDVLSIQPAAGPSQ